MSELTAQQEQDILHREVYLRSIDVVLVYNPTEFDHVINWNKAKGGVSRVIPNRKRVTNDKYGAGYETVPAYMAWQYCKEMAETILNELIKQSINTENARRRDIPGAQPLMFEGEGSEKQRWEQRVRNEHQDLVWVEFDREHPLRPPSENPKNKTILGLLKYRVIEEAGSEPEVTETLTPEKNIDLKTLFGGEKEEPKVEMPAEAPVSPVEATNEPEDTYTKGKTPMVSHEKEL